ncbi:hypothetical protein QAD02_012339 [Eretmocerus hayati]|uniref:Uncharacterized protein n=1 Tax=Eretmocerus hayati TaxID=131215 RepID=A0ACC2NZJ6_9HYME|nr:hypothetical protein QAD02_012339 [Eretmocerus hayati]
MPLGPVVVLAPLLVLLLCAAPSLQEPIFLPAGVTANLFKGLPQLPVLNESAGETRSVYYHDQIVAVVDLAQPRRLLHCELVEVYEPSEAEEILKNLSTILTPHRTSFKDMIKLMEKCDKLDEHPGRPKPISYSNSEKSNTGNPLLAGIVPGTKWCGTGDIARSYHDLGSRSKVDRCCRAHDLCPVKIRAYKSRYNLVNNSFFSKSHCTCDETFFQCLKSINHVSATIMGNIYFNIAQPPCIEDGSSPPQNDVKKFVPVKRQF